MEPPELLNLVVHELPERQEARKMRNRHLLTPAPSPPLKGRTSIMRTRTPKWLLTVVAGALIGIVYTSVQSVPPAMTTRYRPVVMLGLASCVIVGACGASDGTGASDGNGQLVFRWDDIPGDAVPVSMDTVAGVGAGVEGRALASARSRLLSIREEWTYGTLDGPDNTLWAWLRDVATDPEGNVYAVDGMLNLMRVLSPEGELITETFHRGEGPMELRAPRSVEVIRDTVVVFSGFGIAYATGGPRGFTDAGRILPEGASGAEDACVTDALIYLRLSARTEPASVRAVTMAGTGAGSFGSVFDHENPSVRSHMSRGGIACTHEPERIATFFNSSPLIYAYDYSGRSIWVAYLSGFRPTETHGTLLSDGRVQLSRPGRSPEDWVQRLISLPGGLFLVQVLRMGATEMVDGRAITRVQRSDSYLLSARTGAGVYVGPDLPEVLHATEERLFVVHAHDELDYVFLSAYRW